VLRGRREPKSKTSRRRIRRPFSLTEVCSWRTLDVVFCMDGLLLTQKSVKFCCRANVLGCGDNANVFAPPGPPPLNNQGADMDNNTSGFWFQRARNWAVSLTANPELWFAEIDAAQKVAQTDARNAVPLLLLDLSRFLTLERMASQQLMCGQFEGSSDPHRPPLPLYIDLVKATHSALVEFGSYGTTPLIAAYQCASADLSQQLSILRVLADIGDARAGSLIDNLDENTLAAMMSAADAAIWGSKDELTADEWLAEARRMIEQLHIRFGAART
jgi:hypothetical protein